MNRVSLVGRLTRDPELRNTTTGRAVCQFTIAINRTFTNQNGERDADFISCVCWDKQAENLARYQHKGNLISVDGRIQTRNYDDKDGKRVYVTEVLAQNIQFLDSKNSNGGSGINFDNMPEPPMSEEPATESVMETVTVEEKDPFESFGQTVEISDNDLPF